jgi:TonB-linked SusC/RagA family outer membrane protein
MKKSLIRAGCHREIYCSKFLRNMRNTILLLLLSVFQVIAADSYSQSKKLTMDLKDVTVKEILSQIEEQSEFFFLYNTKLVEVDRQASLNVQEEYIQNILAELFTGTDIKYTVFDRQIILSPQDLVKKSPREVPNIIQKSVTGNVTDSDGAPLPGVTIVEKGTYNGTTTDENGKYTITNLAEDAVLVFSFVGMVTKEIEVEDQSVINVTLERDVFGIAEVIAIGYGRARKTDLTGSVTTLGSADLGKTKGTQLSQELQGTMPGVMVTRNSSMPGASANIRIRGITTIGDSEPLIIVDGVAVTNIDHINPNDIDHITVLKDAASASIYGARAAAGVILITTKEAMAGETYFEFNSSFGFEKPTQWPESVGPVRYLQMFNEMQWNDGGNVPGSEYNTFSQDEVENWLEWNKTNPNEYPITDWTDLLINNYAPRQRHQLTMTHGGEVIKSRASINYEKTDAMYDYSNYERIMLRSNNSITFNKFLSGELDFSYNHGIKKDPSANPVNSSHKYAPIYSAMYEDGRISAGKDGSNMYAILHYGGFENQLSDNINGKISLEFKPIKGLTLTGVVAPSFDFYKIKDFNKRISYYDAYDPTIYLGDIYNYNQTSLYETRRDQKTLTKQLLINYSDEFAGSHSLDILAGYEDYYFFRESLDAQSTNLELSTYPYLNVGNMDYMTNYGGAIESAYRSFFGRIMYDYNDKYYLQANFRVDGSSRFHPDYRWASFPSVSGGWVISKEEFMQNISFLSLLKIRGSWGNLGNERIGYYPYQASINFDNAAFWQGDNIIARMTAGQIDYAVRDISWETTQTWDVGFDANLLDNRLNLSFDYYNKNTRDMLLKLEIPNYIGFGDPDQNAGKMTTKGWDLIMGWHDQVGGLNYSVSFNISDYKSVMGDLKGTAFYGDQIIREGSEFNEWYGYMADGIFQTQDEVDASPVLVSSVRPGDIKYVDISGPDGEPDGFITPEYDKVLLGGSLPRYIYGGNMDLNFKNFGLSLFFQGVGKQTSRLTTGMVMPFEGWWQNPPEIIDGNYWSHYNTTEENLNAKYPRLSHISSENNNYELSDYWLINGAYFRLKNITLSYNLPKHLAESLFLKNVRVYTSLTDLFSIDNFPKGWDPEVTSNAYISKTFNFGIDVKF